MVYDFFYDNKTTFSIIKPDSVKKGYIIPIFSIIYRKGFHIKALKMIKITKESAKKFYEEHKNKYFFESLVEFMSSGPIIPMILGKKNAVKDFRILIGDTNPLIAKKGTIRNLYASSIERNAIHGSDNIKKALIEGKFFFSNEEIFFKKKNF
ncbi:nucleoside-diphosphate kinase [Blattabacterium cuenoti]|uniref:nucleoside-diphosphate kinase n=1 Tax=Blattabacterium cuenoti TaxID=1653831 RepID=UPI00163B6440|nr:nucleoside-diphosphate kinase [Blattabacterium cuenoti]